VTVLCVEWELCAVISGSNNHVASSGCSLQKKGRLISELWLVLCKVTACVWAIVVEATKCSTDSAPFFTSYLFHHDLCAYRLPPHDCKPCVFSSIFYLASHVTGSHGSREDAVLHLPPTNGLTRLSLHRRAGVSGSVALIDGCGAED